MPDTRPHADKRPSEDLFLLQEDCNIVTTKANHLKGIRYCTDKKICHSRGTVYLIKCGGCGHRYIGGSGNPLRKRLDKHRRALAGPEASAGTVRRYTLVIPHQNLKW
ncbi:hypothetical protein Y032_0244g3528 [Ancylostoma ceylanicum]|uniref:GIY-YIG domain-containing protein n=1 Tax=Ancylostoma ceylanicum TaxID=53326 RepID=A0A016SDB0_9BILA|nr:hypothetical protein Y032_0244g3528 [Ancylostoma ceylanicum]